MLGENINTSKADKTLIQDLVAACEEALRSKDSLTVSMCGESGSGKSVITLALAEALRDKGLSTCTLHMDNYFKLTPKENSHKRSESLDHVGPSEVDLELLDSHIALFLSGKAEFERPFIDFKKNSRSTLHETVNSTFDVILVEGTYVSRLSNVDMKVLIERTFKDTHIHRTARMREPQSELIENVLAIEHEIVSGFARDADFLISKEFKLRVPESEASP